MSMHRKENCNRWIEQVHRVNVNEYYVNQRATDEPNDTRASIKKGSQA